MDLGIAGKVALLFGRSKGIELGCAQEFARDGCLTLIAARTQETIDTAVAALQAEGLQIAGVVSDCTTKDGIACAVKAAADAFALPDILIFNVDSGPKGAFLDVDDDVFAAANTNNVMAFRWAVQVVFPYMREQGRGSILTIGTNSVKAPHRKLPRAAQNTYRVGTLALSKTLSAELGPFGITVNTLGTGARFLRKSLPTEARPMTSILPSASAPGRSSGWERPRTWLRLRPFYVRIALASSPARC